MQQQIVTPYVCSDDQLGDILTNRGVIGEVRCGFLRIFAPIPYSVVF